MMIDEECNLSQPCKQTMKKKKRRRNSQPQVATQLGTAFYVTVELEWNRYVVLAVAWMTHGRGQSRQFKVESNQFLIINYGIGSWLENKEYLY